MNANGKTLEGRGAGSTIKQDFLASIVVFLVALPLCMGIAIASGVPVAAGLITGIVGGIVVGALAGSPLQVSGPAAGLTVIVYEIVQRFGFETLGIVVLMAGALQFVAGVFKLGQWFRAVSPAVIKGMLAGIGVLIFASQFHVMVDARPRGSGLTNLLSIPESIGKAMTQPELGSSELRRSRMRSLREIGELHRRQAAIADLVDKELSYLASEDEPAQDASERTAAAAAELMHLLPDQDALTADVERAMARLSNTERNLGDGEKSEQIIAACSPAIETSRTAGGQLREGSVQTVREAQAGAVTALAGVSDALKNHTLAAHIGILTIATILLWQAFAPRKIKFVPAPLVAIVVAACGAAILIMPVLYVNVPESLWSDIHFPTWAMLTDAPWVALIQSALVIAVVASAETLLCATAVDQMHQGPRTRYDKELSAQGVGNMICGLFGALPMTGVIVRSTANVQSGGKTRVSAILHGVWLLAFVVLLAFVLRLIPTSALAAILVYTGYKLVNLRSIKELKSFGWGEVAIYVATVVTIVVADLLTGVIVGIALAGAKLLYTFSHLATELKIDQENGRAMLDLHGAATFVRLPRLASELEKVPAQAELHVDFEHLDYIDHACLDLIMTWARQHETTGGKLVIDWESLHARFSRQSRASSRSRASS